MQGLSLEYVVNLWRRVSLVRLPPIQLHGGAKTVRQSGQRWDRDSSISQSPAVPFNGVQQELHKTHLADPPLREGDTLRAIAGETPDTSVQPLRARRVVAAVAPILALTVHA